MGAAWTDAAFGTRGSFVAGSNVGKPAASKTSPPRPRHNETVKLPRLSALSYRRLHLCAGLIACVIVPGITVLDGSSWLAWTMYSKSGTYRVSVLAVDHTGKPRRIAPTELSGRAPPELGNFLAGSERWRHAPVGPTLRRHLGEIAALACKAVPNAVSVEVLLELRSTLDAPVESARAAERCASR